MLSVCVADGMTGSGPEDLFGESMNEVQQCVDQVESWRESVHSSVQLLKPLCIANDERAGIDVAAAFGIKVAETAAVIAMARHRRLIDSARAVFAELHSNDFRIARAAIQAVLARCDQ